MKTVLHANYVSEMIENHTQNEKVENRGKGFLISCLTARTIYDVNTELDEMCYIRSHQWRKKSSVPVGQTKFSASQSRTAVGLLRLKRTTEEVIDTPIMRLPTRNTPLPGTSLTMHNCSFVLAVALASRACSSLDWAFGQV